MNRAAVKFCGAKTRSGGACKRPPVPGKARCRLHGGLNPGAPKGNQNAVKTGEYAKKSLFRDLFDAEEQATWDEIETDKRHQLQEEIKLLTARERLMLKRIKELQSAGTHTVVEITTKRGYEPDPDDPADLVPYTEHTEKKAGTLGQIQAIEDALTRVQNSKAKAIELLIKLDEDKPQGIGNAAQAFLDALNGKVAEVWDDESEDQDAEEVAE
jgi:uncharacterized protein YjcR